MKKLGRFVCLVFLYSLSFCIDAAPIPNNTDTLSLDSIVVYSNSWGQSIRIKDGNIRFNKDLLNFLPKFAGESDYLKSLQFFPNISSNNEYDTSLHIQGGENSHNDIQISGAPVYQLGHMLGLFSSVNTSHYQTLELFSSPNRASLNNRIGATVKIEPQSVIPQKNRGEVNIGPFASQGTINCPLTSTSSLTLSARATYLNLLYSSWLKNDDDVMKYRFYDINGSFISDKGNNLFSLDMYMTHDYFDIKSATSVYDLSTDWDNLVLSGRWNHKFEKSSLEQTIFNSTFTNNLHFRYGGLQFNSPSSISTIGYKSQFRYNGLVAGVAYNAHFISPQSPITVIDNQDEKAHEISEHVEYEKEISKWGLNAGIRLSQFINPDNHINYGFAPSLRVSYSFTNALKATASVYHSYQYLFKSGLSSIGLPIEFWFSADDDIKPQQSTGVTINMDWSLMNGDYSVSMEMFYKRLRNQCEYLGDIMELLTVDYDWKRYLVQGKGYDYGIGIIFQKRNGKLNGWISYSYNKSRRRFDSQLIKGEVLSSHERPHEFNAVASYRLNNNWSFGATFLLASGTPFTAPHKFYIINGSLVSQFGEFNANRLPCYKRLDLSASYEFKRKSLCYTINCTLHNALYLSKPIFYRLKFYDGEYGYRGQGFFTRILPSISFCLKF